MTTTSYYTKHCTLSNSMIQMRVRL